VGPVVQYGCHGAKETLFKILSDLFLNKKLKGLLKNKD
jgi:hypothetical protein